MSIPIICLFIALEQGKELHRGAQRHCQPAPGRTVASGDTCGYSRGLLTREALRQHHQLDSGDAPNPFGRYCTLACCKPTVRRKADVGDVIVGVASARYSHEGKLVYPMRVKEIVPMEDYWDDSRFSSKKPSSGPTREKGDNISFEKGRRWCVVPDAMHGLEHRKRYTGGRNILVAPEFFYFFPNPGFERGKPLAN